MNSTDKFFGELTTSLQEDIKSIRHLATHEMRQQEKELVNRFSGQFEEVHEFMTKSVNHLKSEAKSLQERFQLNLERTARALPGGGEATREGGGASLPSLMDGWMIWILYPEASRCA